MGNWSGHLPFAHDLVAAVRPSRFVELGTHLGESYFGFCQAIAENQVPCVAYAVDTWVGETHAGFYSERVYDEVLAYNQANYSNFSYLLRSLFDDALLKFGDESVDLLHIDGLHTFDAVSHDFYSWLPKVRPGGIVLLHDVCVRHLDFGVWRLWDDLKTKGRTFEFHHGWGLGVFQKPGFGALESDLLTALFERDNEAQEQVRRYYSLAANELEVKHRGNSISHGMADSLSLQVYPLMPVGYQAEHCKTISVEPDGWEYVTVDILEGASGAIRLDPVDRPMIIELRGIALTSAVDQILLWSGSGSELSGLKLGGTLIPLGFDDRNGAFRLFSYGGDPQIYLPSLEATQLDQPLTLKIWLRLRPDLGSLVQIIEANALTEPPQSIPDNRDVELQALRQELVEARSAGLAVRTQLESAQQTLVDEVNRKQTKLYLLEDLRNELKQENKELQERFINIEKAYLELRETFTVLEAAHAELQTSHNDLVHKYDDVLRSRSWRLTAPLRSVTETMKR